MEKIIVNISWAERNFCGSFGEEVPGAVVFTAKTLEGLKRDAQESLDFHFEGMQEDGDNVPQWWINKDYEFVWNYTDVASLIRSCEPYVSMAALSRVSGINQNLLSQYANNMKRPRPQQRQKIVDSIHEIGARLIAVV